MNFIEEFGNITHDRAVSICFMWLWNTYPETRYLCFHPKNETRPEKGETKPAFLQRLARRKAEGIVPGVLDLIFIWRPVQVFDVKMPGDVLSEAQRTFITAVESQGGKGHEIRSFQQFKNIINDLL